MSSDNLLFVTGKLAEKSLNKVLKEAGYNREPTQQSADS